MSRVLALAACDRVLELEELPPPAQVDAATPRDIGGDGPAPCVMPDESDADGLRESRRLPGQTGS